MSRGDCDVPTIFLVTTCKNAQETIELTFESIAQQENVQIDGSFSYHLHYHVQDASSTDGTCKLVQEWGEKFQKIPWCTFTYKSECDSTMYEGIAKAFQSVGPMKANDFMGWLNADDVLLSQCLQTVSDIWRLFPQISWIGGKVSTINDKNEQLTSWEQYYPSELIRLGACNGILWSFIQQEGSFWKRKAWDAVGGIQTKYRLIGDWELWQRMAKYDDYVTVNRAMASFRIRDNQLSSSGYYEEMSLHTQQHVLHKNLRKCILKTKFFCTLQPATTVTFQDGTYMLCTGKKPTRFHALRLLLLSYDAKFLLKVYDFIAKIKNIIKP